MKYKWKTRPYKHQVLAVKKLLSTGFGGALLMEPRTGKTKVCIDYASILHQAGKVSRVLVFMPVSVMGVWEDEIAAHCPADWRITIWDKKGRKRTKLPRNGTTKLDFVLVNYDALSSPGRKTPSGRPSKRSGRIFIRNQLARWQPQLIILDESHRIKNPSARKTGMIHSLAEIPDFKVIATGTAVTKKKRIFDLWAQWMFLNPNNKMLWEYGEQLNASDFKKRWGVWISRNGYKQWVRNRHLLTLRKFIHEDAYAITRDECFDLPKSRVQIVPVTLTDSLPVYIEMAREMIAKLESGEITEAPIKLVQALRLAQITSGVAKTTPTEEHPESKLVRVGREKLDVMEGIMTDLFEADEKIVVAARFREDIAQIVAIAKKLKVKTFELHGGIKNRRERDRNRKAFQAHEGPAMFIMQPQAGSLGIDLSSASVFIWFSLTPSYVDFTQCMDRVALSARAVVYMVLAARGTVDEFLWETLQEDGDVAKAMTLSPQRLLQLSRMRELLEN